MYSKVVKHFLVGVISVGLGLVSVLGVAATEHMAYSKFIRTTVDSATGFVVGHSGPEIVVFMDPNCSFCHSFYEKVLPTIQAGKLRLKIIPVDIFGKTSLAKNVRILSDPDPTQAWEYNEKYFRFNHSIIGASGGIMPAYNLKVPEAELIHKNDTLLSQDGAIETPTIIYCDTDNNPVITKGDDASLVKTIESGEIHSIIYPINQKKVCGQVK